MARTFPPAEFVKCEPMLVVEEREKAVLVKCGALPTTPPVSMAMWWPLVGVQLSKNRKHVVAVADWLLKAGSNRNVRLG